MLLRSYYYYYYNYYYYLLLYYYHYYYYHYYCYYYYYCYYNYRYDSYYHYYDHYDYDLDDDDYCVTTTATITARIMHRQNSAIGIHQSQNTRSKRSEDGTLVNMSCECMHLSI